jgi:DnaK suppressor protein
MPGFYRPLMTVRRRFAARGPLCRSAQTPRPGWPHAVTVETGMTETSDTARDAALKHMLETRRNELRADVQGRLRAGRVREDAVRDALEQTDDDTRGGLAFSLLEMKAETLTLIDRALVRLAAGAYGTCIKCDERIAESRLNALPFAMRCQKCEARLERGKAAPSAADGRGGTTVFARLGSV